LDGETSDFTFYFTYTIKGEKFFVTVTRDWQAYVFDMVEKDSGKWLLGQPAPLWVKPFEEKLADVIRHNIPSSN